MFKTDILIVIPHTSMFNCRWKITTATLKPQSRSELPALSKAYFAYNNLKYTFFKLFTIKLNVFKM